MDREELIKKLLESPRQDWPGAWPGVGVKKEPLPDRVKAAVNAELLKAIEESKSKKGKVLPFRSVSRVILGATGIATAVAASLIVWFTFGRPARVDLQGGIITQVRGDVTVSQVDGKTRVLTGSDLLTRAAVIFPGDTLITGENAQVDFEVARVPGRLGSASRLKLVDGMFVSEKNFQAIRFELTSGIAFLRAGKLDPRSQIRVQTPTAIASVRGTEFVVSQTADSTRTLVQSGSVQMTDSSGGNAVAIEAGNKGQSSPDGSIKTSEKEASEKALLNEMGQNLVTLPDDARSKIEKAIVDLPEHQQLLKRAVEAATSQQGPQGINSPRVIDETLHFSSEDEIQKHYGSIQEVQLKDGRSYRGYVQRTDTTVSIHTQFGVTRIPVAEVESIK